MVWKRRAICTRILRDRPGNATVLVCIVESVNLYAGYVPVDIVRTSSMPLMNRSWMNKQYKHAYDFRGWMMIQHHLQQHNGPASIETEFFFCARVSFSKLSFSRPAFCRCMSADVYYTHTDMLCTHTRSGGCFCIECEYVRYAVRFVWIYTKYASDREIKQTPAKNA